jgi:hypothetical protein
MGERESESTVFDLEALDAASVPAIIAAVIAPDRVAAHSSAHRD